MAKTNIIGTIFNLFAELLSLPFIALGAILSFIGAVLSLGAITGGAILIGFVFLILLALI